MLNKFAVIFAVFICVSCTQTIADFSNDPETLMENAENAAGSGRGYTAFKSANNALQICQEKKDLLCEADAYNTLSIICDTTNVQGGKQCSSANSLNYLNNALNIYKSLGSNAYMARTYLNMAVVEIHLKQPNPQICNSLANSKYYYSVAQNNQEADFTKIAEFRGHNKGEDFYQNIQEMSRDYNCQM